MRRLVQPSYALLAAAGLVVPWLFNLRFMAEGGSWVDLPAVAALAFANQVAASFTSDLLIAFVAFLVFSIAEGRRIGMAWWWVYPLLGATIAFAFAFPLFLLMRDRHLQRAEAIR
jgi:hypothetical protein